MKKEYLVMAQKVYQQKENRWVNVKKYFAENLGEYAYYSTEEEARNALQKYLALWNREFKYDKNGRRVETSVCGSIGIDTISKKEDDDAQRVVRWKIKVREVTDWEEIECE